MNRYSDGWTEYLGQCPEFESHVDYDPVTIRVIEWEPYVPGCTYGHPDHCYPPEGGYGEWEVRDVDTGELLNIPIPEKDRERIDREVYAYMERREDRYAHR